jgi:hypothetical protein
LFRGSVNFRTTADDYTCFGDNDPALNPCTLEIEGLSSQMCLVCDTAGNPGVNWYFETDASTQSISCNTDTPPSNTMTRGTGLYPVLYSRCELGTYESSATTCGDCSAACSTCSGPLAIDCLSCEPNGNNPQYLLAGLCVTCDLSSNYFDPVAQTCTHVSSLPCNIPRCSAGCTPFGKCIECDPGSTYQLGACEMYEPGKLTSYVNDPPVVVNCHSDCTDCVNETERGCLGCTDASK